MDIKRGLMARFSPAKAADRQRDSGNWAEAATLYADLLAKTGRNAATFRYVVQLGNCLKEAGRYEEALAAYDDALHINERNADLHLQLGHLYKLMGNTPASAWAYQQAYNVDPENPHARLEIEKSGGHVASGIALAGSEAVLHTIWFDVTDFIDYARHNVSLSGIQRVCGNLMLSVADMRLQGYRVVPVLPDYDTGHFFSVRYDTFVHLVELFGEPLVKHDNVLSGVTAVLHTKTSAAPGAGDIFVIAGAFWIVSRYDKVADLRRRGVKFGLFIHDLIQIRNPGYVMPDAVDRFTVQLSDAMELCDFVLTNSRYVRDDVRTYLRDTKHRELPVTHVLLPTELALGRSRRPLVPIENPKLQFVLSQEYVLVVSTIEIRKNHALLIRVWEHLREELGEQTPHLVLVGKWGWQIDELHAYIDDRGYEGDWLFIFNGISDVAMGALYANAMFTVYPSFAEGFGLPIGESLAYDKPCIASDTTAMPEVGGDFVRYFNPHDWTSALPVIRQPIVDQEDLRRWRMRIASDFKPKRWNEFCEEFFQSLIECAEATPERAVAPIPLLPSCRLITGGDFDILIAAKEQRPIVTFRAARTRNWHACEAWGVWSSDRRSEISFRSGLSEGDRVDLFLRLHRANSSDSDPAVIADGGAGEACITLNVHPTFYHIIGRVKEDGQIRIHLLVRGKLPAFDLRGIFLGWSGLAYCRHDHRQDFETTMAQLVPIGQLLERQSIASTGTPSDN